MNWIVVAFQPSDNGKNTCWVGALMFMQINAKFVNLGASSVAKIIFIN
jgi:hypothetical protein